MNLGEIKTRVKRQFGDESGAQITDADIIRWANDAQVDIVRQTECLENTLNFAVTAGDNDYIGSDILKVTRVTFDGRHLRHITRNELDLLQPDRDVENARGTPEAFYLVTSSIALTFHLWPYPEAAGTLKILYQRKPVDMALDTDELEIPDEFNEDVVIYCLKQAYELNEDWTAADRKRSEYEERIARARADVQWPINSSYPSVRMIPGDEW